MVVGGGGTRLEYIAIARKEILKRERKRQTDREWEREGEIWEDKSITKEDKVTKVSCTTTAMHCSTKILIERKYEKKKCRVNKKPNQKRKTNKQTKFQVPRFCPYSSHLSLDCYKNFECVQPEKATENLVEFDNQAQFLKEMWNFKRHPMFLKCTIFQNARVGRHWARLWLRKVCFLIGPAFEKKWNFEHDTLLYLLPWNSMVSCILSVLRGAFCLGDWAMKDQANAVKLPSNKSDKLWNIEKLDNKLQKVIGFLYFGCQLIYSYQPVLAV